LELNGGFNGWTRIPGMTTNVPPAVNDGNLAIGVPIMAVLAAPKDGQTYINTSLNDQPPTNPPANYWNLVNPSQFTTMAPAISIVSQGKYMYLAATCLNLSGPNSRVMLNQGNPYTPGSLVGWKSMSFDSNLSPAMAAANNRTVIVAANPDGALFYDWWDLNGPPHGWLPLGDPLRTSVAPAVALVDKGNYMFILARGTDGLLYLNQAIVGGSIIGWQLA
jgi:hypothetical protein